MKRCYLFCFICLPLLFSGGVHASPLTSPADCEAMSPGLFLDPSVDTSAVKNSYLAMTYHRGKNDGNGRTNGCFVYQLSKNEQNVAELNLHACVMASDLEAPLGIPENSSGRWVQDCNFADDNRSDHQRASLGEADHGDLRLFLKFRTSPGSNLTRQNSIVEVDLGMTQVLRHTPFAADSTFASGTVMGQHDMGLIPGEKDQVFGNPWEPRFGLDGRGKFAVTSLSGGIQVFDHSANSVAWSISGWGSGDCDIAGTCRHSVDRPFAYMFDRHADSITDGGLSTGEHNNAAVVIHPAGHFSHKMPQCRVIDSERWYGIVRCQVVDETTNTFNTGWVLHGKHVTQAVKDEWPVVIEDDPLGGPADHHNPNIEYLAKNRVMIFDNGNFHHADPCAAPVTAADIAADPELSAECAKPVETRAGCPFSRAVEYKYKGKVNGADRFAMKFSWPAVEDYPVMLPDDNQAANDLLSDGDKAAFCQPFWQRNYEAKGIVYSSFISGAKRLWNGQTLVTAHDIRARNFTSATEPTQSAVIVDSDAQPVARLLINSDGENSFAHYRVDAVSGDDFEEQLTAQ